MSFEEMLEAACERAVEKVLARHHRPASPDELLSPFEAAALAKVAPDTIRRWVQEGLLRRYGSPRKLRVRREEVLSVQPKQAERSTDDVVAALLKGGRH